MTSIARRHLGAAFIAAFLATAVLPAVNAPSVAAVDAPKAPSYYVAMGDSLAVGFAASPGHGYVDNLLTYYRQRVPDLQLQDFGCSSETTDTFLHGGICTSYTSGAQFTDATASLAAHKNEIKVVTIDIGGNDILPCGITGPPNLPCLQTAIETWIANLKTILTGIRDAVGPSVPILGMNYFNPFLVQWLTPGAAQHDLIHQVVQLDDLFQPIIANVYKPYSIPIADVKGAFQTDNFTDIVQRFYGQVPVNVANACDWLDIYCSPNGPLNFGDDANATGYQVIAKAFEAVSPADLSSNPDVSVPRTTQTTTTPAAKPAQAVTATPQFTG